jgi:hypothetical protein
MKPYLTRLMSLAMLAATVALAPAQSRVDHSAWQTPIRSQGDRNTCQTFGAVAALEARYKRAGYGDLDLSEEFVNHMGKMMWLHPVWSDISTADRSESQVGAFGGGGGGGHAHNFTHWMKVPLETAMPYRAGGYPGLPAWDAPHWQSQRNQNTFNLDPANFPDSARRAANYYSATGVVDMTGADSRNPAAIEAVLRAGYEVIWDTFLESGSSNTPAIWHDTPAGTNGSHVMLIVGYDRTSSNPNNHYFIVKNSWGGTTNPGGYTYIGYDFVAAHGIDACYLTGASTPGPWRELRAIGRRNISLDGHRGTLDIYHLPGASSDTWSTYFSLNVNDSRLGTFYDLQGNAYRVNGFIVGDLVTFWWKGSNPNMRWDETRETPTLGRMFSYRLLENAGNDLAGYHWDNAGGTPTPAYGGYAKRPSTINATDGFESPVFNNAQPWAPEQWLGRWTVRYDSRRMSLLIDYRNDLLLPTADRATWAGFQAYTFDLATATWRSLVVRVDRAQGREIRFTVDPAQDDASCIAYMQSWSRGVAAGRATVDGNILEGVLMVRGGEQDLGSFGSFGSGCGGPNTRPLLTTGGLPEIGAVVRYQVSPVPFGGLALFALGLSNTASNGAPLPLDLGLIGAPGCAMLVDPYLTILQVAGSSTTATTSLMILQSSLRGIPIYAQAYVLDATANAAGFRTSNGVRVTLGGAY